MNDTKWIVMSVVSVKRETPLLTSLRLEPALEGSKFDFRAGQFVKILCPGGSEAYFAVSSEPEEKKHIEFLIKGKSGPARELTRLKEGGQLKVSYAMGTGYPLERMKGKDILFICMGSALAPIRSALKSILKRDQDYGRPALLYGARSPEDVPYAEEFEIWKKKIRVEISFSRGNNAGGRVMRLAEKLSIDPSRTAAIVCGSKEMQEEVKDALRKKGMSEDNIYFNH